MITPDESKREGAAALAERVRAACVDAALEAYEDAGVRGLCGEGRWEYAVAAIKGLDLRPLLPPRAGTDG